MHICLAQLSVACMHGDLTRAEREAVMAQFQTRAARLLVTTDACARYFDLTYGPLVINYDVPTQNAHYFDRCELWCGFF